MRGPVVGAGVKVPSGHSKVVDALANLASGYLGARTAIAAGSKFVRRAFFVLVAILSIRLAIDIF